MAKSAEKETAQAVGEDGPATPTQKDPNLIQTSEINDLAEPDDPDAASRWPWERARRKPIDLDAIATKRSVFDDPALSQFYLPRPDHENIHCFSIPFRWTHREERSVRRKTDVRIFIWILVMFFALNIDRGNLSNAVADNLLDDLRISTNDYNNAQNMYRVGFLVAEIPSQMIGKWLGPDRWIPVQIILWSVASGGQFWMRDRAGFFACRFLIGLFMGGFIPDAVLYLSYFYTKAEMPIRLAFFWFVDSMSGVVASFIAYGVLHMRGVEGREGWRWLFLIEALISIVIGFLSFLFLVPGPTQTRTWWNPRGYFDEREERIIVNRVLRDDPSKGDMHNRQAISLRMLWRSLKDYDLWPESDAEGHRLQHVRDDASRYSNHGVRGAEYAAHHLVDGASRTDCTPWTVGAGVDPAVADHRVHICRDDIELGTVCGVVG